MGQEEGGVPGLTGACCRRGAGRRPGSPPPKSSLSQDAPWLSGELCSQRSSGAFGEARFRPLNYWLVR